MAIFSEVPSFTVGSTMGERISALLFRLSHVTVFGCEHHRDVLPQSFLLTPSKQCFCDWLAIPLGPIEQGDMLLAQKIAFETMETDARTVANSQRAA
jgi:hypothetical protein